jgi:hypothetical protein
MRLAEAPGSRTQPARETRAATGFEDREGHRAPFTSVRNIVAQPFSGCLMLRRTRLV